MEEMNKCQCVGVVHLRDYKRYLKKGDPSDILRILSLRRSSIGGIEDLGTPCPSKHKLRC